MKIVRQKYRGEFTPPPSRGAVTSAGVVENLVAKGWVFRVKWEGVTAVAFSDGKDVHFRDAAGDKLPESMRAPDEAADFLARVFPPPFAVCGEVIFQPQLGVDWLFVVFDAVALAGEMIYSIPWKNRFYLADLSLRRSFPQSVETFFTVRYDSGVSLAKYFRDLSIVQSVLQFPSSVNAGVVAVNPESPVVTKWGESPNPFQSVYISAKKNFLKTPWVRI